MADITSAEPVTRVCAPSPAHVAEKGGPREFITIKAGDSCPDCLAHFARAFWATMGFGLPATPTSVERHTTEPNLYKSTAPRR
jgi:hypothetical protein